MNQSECFPNSVSYPFDTLAIIVKIPEISPPVQEKDPQVDKK
jgi:hypothetical protein